MSSKTRTLRVYFSLELSNLLVLVTQPERLVNKTQKRVFCVLLISLHLSKIRVLVFSGKLIKFNRYMMWDIIKNPRSLSIFRLVSCMENN